MPSQTSLENFHTHTFRCKHASGDVEDYLKEALKAKMKVIGISDHTALPDNRWLHIRMDINELDSYTDKINQAKLKYQTIEVLKAMECEYEKDYISFFQDELLGKRKYDYLIGAGHFSPYHGDWIPFYEITRPEHLKAYTKQLIKTISSGLFAFIAHPDAFGSSYLNWDEHTIQCTKEICSAAEAYSVPLEINGLGFRRDKVTEQKQLRAPYPWPPFWEIASSYNISVICNSDAHHPTDIANNIDDARQLAKKFNLKLFDTSKLRKGKYLK